jgi:acetyl-CoA C-acetyltransferase
MPSAFTSDALVYDAIRLPRARVRKDGGTLSGVPAHHLLAQLLGHLAERGVDPQTVDDLLIGVSTAAGEQSAVGRTAVMTAGWPDEVPSGVVSRLCCSGLDALGSAAAQVASGAARVVVAGGVESMSRVPMMSDRPGFAMDPELGDVTGFVTIGVSADATALEHGITRDQLDAYAVRSHERSLAAPTSPRVMPAVDLAGNQVLTTDEGPRASTLEALAAMSPLFSTDPGWARVATRLGLTPPEQGLHTVATAPQMCDGASLAVIGSAAATDVIGREPVARIASIAHVAGRSPRLDSVVPAARRALERAGLTAQDIDVAEINESFAVTPILTADALGIPMDRVNIHGGSISVGHPLGASGGILLANAISELERSGGRHALLAIPAALGLSTAIVVELL